MSASPFAGAAVREAFVREIELRRELVPSFERYPFNLPAIRELDRLPLHPAVTFLVGENGSGKSTLMEAMAVALGFNAEGGSRNFSFGTRDSHSALHQYLRPVRSLLKPRDGYFLRAESLFNVATEIERLDAIPSPSERIGPAYGARALHEQSHGESFLALIENRLRGNGLYLLDEPEAALSPVRQMTLIAVLHRLVRAKSQFIIATHSPILLSYPDAAILQLDAGGISQVSYEETEHFTVTRDFLNRYPAMLRVLLAEDDDQASLALEDDE
jgi:predicted ATPase